MESNESPSVRLIRFLTREIDELIVQLSLGKGEAIARVEGAKRRLAETIGGVCGNLPPSEAHRRLAEMLERLRVQLALGGMESRDAYESARTKIDGAIGEVREELHHLEGKAREELSDAIDGLQTRLGALALDLGIGAVVAEDELKTRKEEFSAQAERVAAKLKRLAASVGQEADAAATEARTAYDEIRDNLRRLFH